MADLFREHRWLPALLQGPLSPGCRSQTGWQDSARAPLYPSSPPCWTGLQSHPPVPAGLRASSLAARLRTPAWAPTGPPPDGAFPSARLRLWVPGVTSRSFCVLPREKQRTGHLAGLSAPAGQGQMDLRAPGAAPSAAGPRPAGVFGERALRHSPPLSLMLVKRMEIQGTQFRTTHTRAGELWRGILPLMAARLLLPPGRVTCSPARSGGSQERQPKEGLSLLLPPRLCVRGTGQPLGRPCLPR